MCGGSSPSRISLTLPGGWEGLRVMRALWQTPFVPGFCWKNAGCHAGIQSSPQGHLQKNCWWVLPVTVHLCYPSAPMSTESHSTRCVHLPPHLHQPADCHLAGQTRGMWGARLHTKEQTANSASHDLGNFCLRWSCMKRSTFDTCIMGVRGRGCVLCMAVLEMCLQVISDYLMCIKHELITWCHGRGVEGHRIIHKVVPWT